MQKKSDYPINDLKKISNIPGNSLILIIGY